jgi:hypothetical protein
LSGQGAESTALDRVRKWAWETGAFFDGLKADSPAADIEAAAPGFPGLPHRPGQLLTISVAQAASIG